MDDDIVSQLIGCKTAAAVWMSVHAMIGAQTRANVCHIQQQLQFCTKEDLSAAQ
jgi:cell division protein FtsB